MDANEVKIFLEAIRKPPLEAIIWDVKMDREGQEAFLEAVEKVLHRSECYVTGVNSSKTLDQGLKIWIKRRGDGDGFRGRCIQWTASPRISNFDRRIEAEVQVRK